MLYFFVNGDIVPQTKAMISVDDIGLQRGYGVFDFLRTYHGRPFILSEHLARLRRSAKAIGLTIPLSDEKISRIISDLIKKNKLPEAAIKIIVTGGESADGMIPNLAKPNIIISAKPIPAYPSHYFTRGVKLITHNHLREESTAKTINYLTMIKLGQKKRQAGAIDILYLGDGLVYEGACSNFFLFKGDTLVTAKSGILAGTRRKIVLELARKKFKVEVRDVKSSELAEATEAFITSTTRDIMPVVKIDNKKVGDGKVGKNTKVLMAIFSQLVNTPAAK